MKTNNILTYSSIERHRHGILGAEAYLGIILFMFPLVPILLAIFSCFVRYLPNALYTRLFMLGTIVLLGVFLISVFHWLLELMTVYMIGEDGELYMLHISLFWYQIKGCTELVNPVGMNGNWFTKVIFMVQNIRIALERSSEISFDELIEMGRLTRISGISKVCVKKKSLTFWARVETKKGASRKKVSIRKVYDRVDGLELYLKTYEEEGVQKAAKQDLKVRRSVEELLGRKKTEYEKIGRFLFTWTCIMLWLCLFTVYPDLNKLSKMNEGEYISYTATLENPEKKKTKAEIVYEEQTYIVDVLSSHGNHNETPATISLYINREYPYEFFYADTYGVSYKPMAVIYLTVAAIYLVLAITQIIIDSFHRKLT